MVYKYAGKRNACVHRELELTQQRSLEKRGIQVGMLVPAALVSGWFSARGRERHLTASPQMRGSWPEASRGKGEHFSTLAAH